jgi:hypothetical protein
VALLDRPLQGRVLRTTALLACTPAITRAVAAVTARQLRLDVLRHARIDPSTPPFVPTASQHRADRVG